MKVYATFIADCQKAYDQAELSEEVCVEGPAEYRAMLADQGLPSDIVWRLWRMLPGQRVAGAGWMKTASGRLRGAGYEQCPGLP